ncbi:hypothetical protein [Actinoplanes sp. L3-i22]|uniref:hypothetical protein n=1 Tax=Actinoplanes sp. L3-i22 TaxID=2836373 RepID=UPI001C84A32B|nr:hypothetical protein [Actinoplanes sp. L3-i22]
MAHLSTAYAGIRTGNLGLAGLALGMSVLCLPCVARLWRGPDRVTWLMTAAMTAAMLAAHGSLMTLAGHHHGGSVSGPNLVAGLLLLVSTCAATSGWTIDWQQTHGHEPLTKRMVSGSMRPGE